MRRMMAATKWRAGRERKPVLLPLLLVALVACVGVLANGDEQGGERRDRRMLLQEVEAEREALTRIQLRGKPPGSFHNLWAVHVDGDADDADAVADSLGFHNHGQIGGLDRFYHFSVRCKEEVGNGVEGCVQPHRHAAPHTHRLLNETRVIWAEQQRLLHRPRRYVLPLDMSHHASSSEAVQTSADAANHRVRRDFDESAYASGINDPQFTNQWHLYQAHSNNHHNVLPVWHAGITGKGVVVTIVDDGIEYTHPDLKDNYDAKASTDINGNDDDPFPDERHPINKHGTRCSGEVAAARDNNKCGVGIAYEARIGGIRMLDGAVTDSVEAHSLSLNPQHIDVYSNSWGPNDDGRTMEGPATLARKAFDDGIAYGRGGLGSIYLFASGNGGTADDCNCDGYTNSPYTLSIGAIDEHNNMPYYTEKCASTMAVTYSSGSGSRSITTVDLHNGCTHSHTGTSAAAPLAAGLVALVLQANPGLTWRDVQHVITRSTRTIGGNHLWDTNKAGFKVSYAFGFGVLDAEKLVAVAREWENKPEQLQHKNKIRPGASIPSEQRLSDALVVAFDVRREDTTIEELEHVQVAVNINSRRRGDIVLDLEAPSGTTSKLLTHRSSDRSSRGIHWTFMTVRDWGESPFGKWKLYARNFGSGDANLVDATLILYGTTATGTGGPDTGDDDDDDDTGVVVTCPTGTYEESGHCHKCHEECGSGGCTGAGPSKCVNCQHYVHEETCIASCGDVDMLSVDDSKECIACHPQCKGCFGRSAYECVKCVGLTLREGGQIQCVESCPKHHFPDSEDKCQQCHPECDACEGPGPNSCIACVNVKLENGTCIDECPPGTFENKHGVCIACDELCRDTCTGAGPTKCDACKGLRLQIEEAQGEGEARVVTKCVEECPVSRIPNEHNVCVCGNHTYPDHGSLACLSCHSECLTGCSGPDVTDCIGPCAHVQHGIECVDQCPANFYASEDTAAFHALYPHADIRSHTVCLPCHKQCASSCTGPTASDCSAPQDGGPRCVSFEEDGKCVAECSRNTYVSSDSSACLPCDAECSGCVGEGPDACLQCKHVRSSGTCLSSCPPHTYATERSVCEECHPECADVCFGPTDRQCFPSPDSVGAIAPSCQSVHLESQCLAECPAGYYENESFGCVPCDAECGTEGCTGAAPTACKSCKHLLGSAGACTRQCEANEYVDDAQACRGCSTACKHGCTGPTADDCQEEGGCSTPHKSCPSNSYFDTASCSCVEDACPSGIMYQGNCVPACPAGTYQSVDDTTCLPCETNCDACTGPTPQECTACVYAGLENSDGTLTCFAEAACPDPSRQFLDSSNSLCKPCHEECDGCFAGTNRDCKACRHVQSQGTCLTKCPTGFFAPSTGDGSDSNGGEARVCAPCDAECAGGCSGPTAGNCTSCRHVRLGDACVSVCPASTFHDTAAEECVTCDAECLLGCHGPTAAQCAEGRCVNLKYHGRCVSTCPHGFFANMHSECEGCHSTCSGGCVDSTPEGCLDESTVLLPTTTDATSQHATTPPDSSAAGATGTATTTATTATAATATTVAKPHGTQPAVATTTPVDKDAEEPVRYKGRVPTSSIEIGVAAALLLLIALVVLIIFTRTKQRGPGGARTPYQKVKMTDLANASDDDDVDDSDVDGLAGDSLVSVGFDVMPEEGMGLLTQATKPVKLLAEYPQQSDV